MASLTPKKMDLSQINNGEEYANGDGVQASTINSVIQATAYVQSLATNPIDDTDADNEGTPQVYIEETENGARFVFKNLKGKHADIPLTSLRVGDYVDNLSPIYILWNKFDGVNYRVEFSSGAYISCYGQTSDPTITYADKNGITNGLSMSSESNVLYINNIDGTVTSMSGSYYDGTPVDFTDLFSFALDESETEYVLGLTNNNLSLAWFRRNSSQGTKLYRHTVEVDYEGHTFCKFSLTNSRKNPYQNGEEVQLLLDMGSGIYACYGENPGEKFFICYKYSDTQIRMMNYDSGYDIEIDSINSDIVEEI